MMKAFKNVAFVVLSLDMLAVLCALIPFFGFFILIAFAWLYVGLGIFAALTLVMVRRMTLSKRSHRTLLVMSCIAIIVGVIAAPFFWMAETGHYTHTT